MVTDTVDGCGDTLTLGNLVERGRKWPAGGERDDGNSKTSRNGSWLEGGEVGDPLQMTAISKDVPPAIYQYIVYQYCGTRSSLSVATDTMDSSGDMLAFDERGRSPLANGVTDRNRTWSVGGSERKARSE